MAYDSLAIIAVAGLAGAVIATSVALSAALRELRAMEQQVLALARTDGLTGLSNQRTFASELTDEVARAARTGSAFSVLCVDLDGLKGINDSRGHAAGDAAIRRVARALYGTCREVDTVARVGGDEFAVLLPHSDRLAAVAVAERVCDRLAESADAPVTISWGVATYPYDGITPEALVMAADRHMYADKARGRAPRPEARTPVLPAVFATAMRPSIRSGRS